MSKLHEIREVYLEDIAKKSKMTKGIIGESLGEISRRGVNCCETFEDAVLWGLIKRQRYSEKNYWFLGEYDESHKNPRFDEPSVDLSYCPFCSKELKLGK